MKFLQRLHSPDQRAAYRVQATGEDARLWVGISSGPMEAQLEDISARGCGFILPQEAAEGLAVGDELVLRLLVGGAGMKQLFVRAALRNRIEQDEGGPRFGAEFLDPERLYTQLKEPQWLYFNRRGAFRVPPADARGRPLRARFHLPGRAAPRSIALHDLSSSGLSVALRPENDVTFPRERSIRVTFTLPVDAVEVELAVRFVHSTMVQGRRRVGFRIDQERTKDVEVQTETLLRYVLERQRQLLSQD
ncbi:MAG: PilZ domain-containing protein [Planctomycetota bacterium]